MAQFNFWEPLAIFQTVIIVGLILWIVALRIWIDGAASADASRTPASNGAALAEPQQDFPAIQNLQTMANDFEKRHPQLPIPAAFPQVVPVVSGKTSFTSGDNITITEVRGTAGTISVGQVYQIKGTYTLASQDQATMVVEVTAKDVADGVGSQQSCQWTTIKRGQNVFTLVLPMRCEGWPHLNVHVDGKNIDDVYFGSADSVLKP